MLTVQNSRRNGRQGILANVTPQQLMQVAKQIGSVRETINQFRNLAKGAPAKPRPPQAKPPRSRAPPASKMVEAPVSQGVSSTSLVRSQVLRSTGSSSTIRGTTVLGSVTTPDADAASSPLCVFFASSNPVTFLDRLQITASTYDKYVYKKVRLIFVPQVSTSTSGTVIIAIDRDYFDEPQTTNLAQTLSYESVASGSVWSGHSCSMSRDRSEMRSYFTNFTGDTALRETEQFKFYAYSLGCPRGTTLGYMMLEYELELISPVYAPSEITSNLASIGIQQGKIGISISGSSSLATVTGLPADRVNPGAVYELVVPTGANTSAFTVGVGGSPWTPVGASVRMFLRAQASGGVAQYVVFTDYPSVVSGNTNVSGLYNASVTNATLVSGIQCVWRLLTGTSPLAE